MIQSCWDRGWVQGRLSPELDRRLYRSLGQWIRAGTEGLEHDSREYDVKYMEWNVKNPGT